MKLTEGQKETGKALAIGLPVVAALHYADSANTLVTAPTADNLSSAQTARTLVGLALAASGAAWWFFLRRR